MADKQEKQYQKAIKECQKLVYAYNTAIKEIHPKDERRLSGYSAHTKPGKYAGLGFNGTQDLAHESFYFAEHFRQNEEFAFCKTNRKPYDAVVTACLTVLKHHLGDGIDITSDGRAEEWQHGLELAEEVLEKTFKIPIGPQRVAV